MTQIQPNVRLRVGCIPYLITSPFTFNWNSDESFELIMAPPRQIAHLARANEIDAACLPLDDARSLQRRFEPLGQLGLVVNNGEGSVALFASRIEVDLLGQAPIGVSMQAATARHVLHILLVKRYGVASPQFIPFPPDQTQQLGAYLTVGDAAFRSAREPRADFPHTYDLATAWLQWTNTPLVLGRWMVRKTLPDKQKQALLHTITSNLQAAQSQPDAVIDYHNSRVTTSSWDRSNALKQLAGCTYHIDDTAKQSIDLFQQYVRSLRPKKRSWRDKLAEG